MEGRREVQRTRIGRDVLIVTPDNAPPIHCTMRDVTAKGARLSGCAGSCLTLARPNLRTSSA